MESKWSPHLVMVHYINTCVKKVFSFVCAKYITHQFYWVTGVLMRNQGGKVPHSLLSLYYASFIDIYHVTGGSDFFYKLKKASDSCSLSFIGKVCNNPDTQDSFFFLIAHPALLYSFLR